MGYPKPSLTVDVVVFGIDERDRSLDVLLIRRKGEPFKGQLALPGGFVEPKETLEQAAFRELREETGIKPTYIEQLYTFGDPGRDPRGWTVSVAYFALVSTQNYVVQAGSDASEARWYNTAGIMATVKGVPPALAFDHNKILKKAHERLEAKVRYAPLGFDLLPKNFSIGQIHGVYEAILGREIDKRNFYRNITSIGVLEETGAAQTSGKGKPARLYRFNRQAYERLTRAGINFEV